MFHFCNSWKHVFRRYRGGTLVKNGLMKIRLTHITHAIIAVQFFSENNLPMKWIKFCTINSISVLIFFIKAKTSSQTMSQMPLYHCIKCCNFTYFPRVEILWKRTVYIDFGQFALNSAETAHFQKISTPGN